MDAFSVLTVTKAASTRDMTTLKTVKDELGITDTKSDPKIARWIRVASGAIETYTRRVFAKESVIETFYLRGITMGLPIGVSIAPPLSQMPLRFDPPGALRLSRFPIVTVTSVTEDGIVLDPSNYLSDEVNGLLYRLNSDGVPTRWTARVLAIEYIGGYALLGDLPWELEQAAILLVKGLWFTSSRDPTLRQISVPGVQEETYWVGASGDNGAFPPDVAGLLDSYREQHV